MRRGNALARPGFIRKTASTSCEGYVMQVWVGGNAGDRRLFHPGVAVTAVEAETADVMRVTERHWLVEHDCLT